MAIKSFITQTTDVNGEVQRGLYGEHQLFTERDKEGNKIYVIKDKSYRKVAILPFETTTITIIQ